MYYYGFGDQFYPHMWWGLGFLSHFLFWLLIFFVVFSIFKRRRMDFHSKDAIEILKERYAKGEINKEQFDLMKKDISNP